MIDQASVFAERFKGNPQALQATVLGQGNIPGLDPYTALNALRLIKESNAMQMAAQAQQPTSSPSIVAENMAPPPMQQGLGAMVPNTMGQAPQGQAPQGQAPQGQAPQAPQAPVMQASGGLAGMHVPEEDYAAGGIVAFAGNKGSLVGYGSEGEETDPRIGQSEILSEGGGDSTDEADARPGFTSAGDPVTYGKLAAQLPGAIENIANYGDKSLTPDEYRQIRADEIAAYREAMGPNTAKDALKADVAERKGERGRNLQEGKGVALLKAAAAMAQGNNWVRAFGNAGAAFGDEYNRALQADKVEKRSIALAEFNMADAQRKENLGLFKEGRAAADRASVNQQAANKAGLEKTKALADALTKGMVPTRPLKSAGASAGPKLPEQLGVAEVNYAKNPTKENKIIVDGLRKAVAATKASTSVAISDIRSGGPKDLAGQAIIESKENIEMNKALDKHKRMNAREWKKDVEAAGSVEAAEAQFKKKYITGNPQPAAAGVATSPPKSTTTSKVLSQADVEATIAASVAKGKTRQEVMDALKANGYTVK